jgi:hypothetical protein
MSGTKSYHAAPSPNPRRSLQGCRPRRDGRRRWRTVREGAVFEATNGDVKLGQQFCVGVDGWAAEWEHAPNGIDEVTVVRTVPTASGFVTELTERNREDTGKEITGREIVLCTVRDGRISELTVYCSGDWDEELRARHAAEAPMLRP